MFGGIPHDNWREIVGQDIGQERELVANEERIREERDKHQSGRRPALARCAKKAQAKSDQGSPGNNKAIGAGGLTQERDAINTGQERDVAGSQVVGQIDPESRDPGVDQNLEVAEVRPDFLEADVASSQAVTTNCLSAQMKPKIEYQIE